MARLSGFGLLMLLCGCFVLAASLSDTVYYDSFDKNFDGRWVVSQSSDYGGVWKHAKSEGHDDYGLLVSQPAKKYGIAVDLPEKVDPKDGAVVLQYDLRLQNGLECGGAYLKFLQPQEAGWTANDFNNESPYSIMFGPDKCGATNKVHFIFRHKNPKSGKYVEHHLKNPPSPVGDKLSHVYTAVIYPNNTLKLLIDGEEKKTADLLSDDFEPTVIPPKTIPDPEDSKPEDWDDRAKIPDPDATKPDDWDEDAPREIEDAEAERPEGWLDDEPDEVDDPDAVKPEDWDDEEDGEWEPPKTTNPKCEEAPGCGEWKRPMKKNPAFKGKWRAPMIDNPRYQGIWAPKQIPNPDYFELEKPNLEAVAAIGIEIWTMQDGILFDNILVAHDEGVAEEYRKTTWLPKHTAEKEKEAVEEKKAEKKEEKTSLDNIKEKVFETLNKVTEVPQLAPYKEKIEDLLEKAEKNSNITLAVLASIPVLLLTMLLSMCFGGKKSDPSVAAIKKEDLVTEDDDVKEEPVEDEQEQAGEIEKESGARRRARRDT
jgi:calnexin